jgi:hypothetical protein
MRTLNYVQNVSNVPVGTLDSSQEAGWMVWTDQMFQSEH